MIEAQIVLDWKREERVATLRQILRKQLEARFGPLPEASLKQIDATEDVGRLDAALLQVLVINTLEELEL